MRFVKQGLKLEKILYVLMNDKSWHMIYVVLFFSILIATTLFLFSDNNSKSVNPRISVIVMKLQTETASFQPAGEYRSYGLL